MGMGNNNTNFRIDSCGCFRNHARYRIIYGKCFAITSHMKTIITLGLLFTFVTFSSCDTLNQVAQAAAQTSTTPSQLEMVSGLKQALEQGTNKSTSQLSA